PTKIPTVWFASIIRKGPTSPKSPTRISPTPQNVSTTAPVNVTTTKHPARYSSTNPQVHVALEIGRRGAISMPSQRLTSCQRCLTAMSDLDEFALHFERECSICKSRMQSEMSQIN